MTLPAGSLLGAYEILSFVGAGGMGEVYRARDRKLHRIVALKLLSPDVAGDDDRRRQFHREARALAALNHPHIAQIYGIEALTLPSGESADALIMEFADGETLEARLRRGALRWPAAAPLVGQIVEALDAAHSVGIVHRDLKPANICLASDGTVKIVDFGLARPAAPLADIAASTASFEVNAVVGTFPYMSPEQTRGDLIDGRTDIWAFGCVFYEVLTGSRAFSGATWTETFVAIAEKDPDWRAIPADVPGEVTALIRHCLAKNPRERLRDIADARIYLEREPVPPPPVPVRASGWRTPLTWVAAGGLAAGLTGLAWVGRPVEPDRGPEYARATRLTTGPSVALGPAISPDGQWVTYIANSGSQTDLMVRYVNGGDAVSLTRNSGLQLPVRTDIGGPAVSPDGSLIAFDAGARPGTPANLFDSWVIPAPLGGIPRKLVERGRSVRWSPDGTRIVYVRAGAAAGDAIYVANADGSDERMVVAPRGGMHAHWPQWAHDGSAIYFSYSPSTINEPIQIFKVQPSGQGLEPVVETPRRAGFPMPLPDGGGLIYAANPDTSDLGLWWRPLGAGVPQRLTTGLGEYTEPSVSRDGHRLVAAAVQFDRAIVSIDTAGSAALAPLLPSSPGDLDPTVSPDGTRIVMSSARAGGRTLWNVSLADRQVRPLTSGDVFDERPAFSPDGSRIAFVSDRGGRRGIWAMNSDGGAPHLVAHVDVLDSLSWSPDGTRLVFSAPAGDAPALFLVTVADGSTTQITTPAPAASPAWCSERDVILYVEARAATAERPSSSRMAAVTSDGVAVDLGVGASPNLLNGFPVCSWDGKRVLAIVDPGAGLSEIWMAALEPVQPFRRILEAPAQVRLRGGAWLPQGATVLLGSSIRSADVVLFERVNPARP